jgi:pyridoxamine 5'-phosphate oxidase-like protein
MTTTDTVGELDARFSAPDAAATSWADVCALVEKADLFWISTVRADGHPHVTPLPDPLSRRLTTGCRCRGELASENCQMSLQSGGRLHR